jgi:hypothetical protein
LQKPKHFAGAVQISIAAGRPDKRKRASRLISMTA